MKMLRIGRLMLWTRREKYGSRIFGVEWLGSWEVWVEFNAVKLKGNKG